jgi:uncharacterized protein
MYVSKWNLYFDTPEPESKVILNVLSGSMDLLDNEALQFFTHIQEEGHIQPTEHNRTLLMEGLERGYVFNDKQEEEARLAETSQVWYESIENRVESITIYPTFACNLRCVYCFESQDVKSRPGIMSPEMLTAMMKAIDIVHEAHGSSQSPMVTIFGGEPLLGRSAQVVLIEELLGALKRRDFHVGVITNGVALPRYSQMLSDYGVGTVEVTMDGPKEIHDQRRIFHNGRGSFDNVVEGIDAALASKLHVMIRVNVDKQNIEYLPNLANFILGKGWVDQGVELALYAVDAAGGEHETCSNLPGPEMLSRVFDLYNSEETVRIFSLEHRTVRFFENLLDYQRLPFPQIHFCGATAGNKYSFDLFGKVFPCCCMNACELDEFDRGEFYPELRLNDEVMDIWRRRNVLNLPRCRSCPEALLCGGGCTRLALMSGEGLVDGVFCPPSIREEIQTVLNSYYPRLKAKLLYENEANALPNGVYQ